MDAQHGSSPRLLGWDEILEDRGFGDSITFESLAKFHDDLWSSLDAELDRILA